MLRRLKLIVNLPGCQSRMLHGTALQGAPRHVCVSVSVPVTVRDSTRSSLVGKTCMPCLCGACACAGMLVSERCMLLSEQGYSACPTVCTYLSM